MFSFLIIAAIYWMAIAGWFAVVQKPLFGFYNRRESAEPLSAKSWLAAERHGIRTDMIIASYLTAIPLLLLAAAEMIPHFDPSLPLLIYNILIALVIGLISTADTLLYRFWKYKIDSSVFAYMRSFKGATASVSAGYLAGGITAWIAVSATFFAAVTLAVYLPTPALGYPPESLTATGYAIVPATTLIAIGGLFLVVRGLGIRPNSPSIAYFSHNPLLNHTALNPAYSLLYSLSRQASTANQFVTMEPDECERMFQQLFPAGTTRPDRRLLRTDRPDIMLVIWESFGAEFSAAFGGRGDVCREFDRMADEGIRFTSCTAGSFRTDRGLVNLLSGYPAQPTMSVIQHTRKLPSLPGLARTLAAEGYVTEAIHGGDLSIMNKNDYYLASGHRHLLDQRNFPAEAPKGKWGVHDEAAMQLAADEAIRLHGEGKRYMITLQTLSSHEPFDVPYDRLPQRDLNSFAYTDMALGRMIDRLKHSEAWSNLLLIVVADHGFNASMLPDCRLSYSHIPLLMTGGAIAAPAEIDTIMSQTDLAATLLAQMDLPHDDFIFSRDILSPDYRDQFALHIFNNGIMIVDRDGYTVRDTMLDQTIEGTDDPRHTAMAKAILQKLYSDLDQR